jgi:hypothetical protein
MTIIKEDIVDNVMKKLKQIEILQETLWNQFSDILRIHSHQVIG